MSYPLRLQTHNGNNVPLGLYKDISCTVPATTDGDLVAAWRDELSGSLLVASQSTSSKRPVLRFINNGSGTMPVLEFDGVDDTLIVPSLTWAPGSVYFSFMPLGMSTQTTILSMTSPRFLFVFCSQGGVQKLTDGSAQISRDRPDNYWQQQAICTPSAGQREFRASGSISGSTAASDVTYSGQLNIMSFSGGPTNYVKGYLGSVIFSTTGPYDSALDATITSLGTFVETRTTIIKPHGDSITAGNGSSGQLGAWPGQLQGLLGSNYRVLNFGIPSQLLSSMVGNAASQIDATWPASTVNKVVVCFGGTNDLVFSGGSASSAVISSLQTYWAARRSAGEKVVAVTILPRSDSAVATFETDRHAVNTYIRAHPELYDALADVAADNRIGDSGDELSSYFSGDKVHPSNSGYAVIASIINSAVNQIVDSDESSSSSTSSASSASSDSSSHSSLSSPSSASSASSASSVSSSSSSSHGYSESSSSSSPSSHSSPSSESSSPSSESAGPLPLHANSAQNTYPSVLINDDDPGRVSQIDQMVYQIVVAQPLRGPVTVDLGSPYANSEIRYTLNGKNPTNTSRLYTAPLVFNQNATGGHTTVKARIYDRRNSNLKGKIIRVAFRVIPSR